MTTLDPTASNTASMRPEAGELAAESDCEGDLDSSYAPSLASPTTRDSLDEGYDPDETLKITVYDNNEIKINSSGMFHDNLSSENDDSDDVEFYEAGGANLNQVPNRAMIEAFFNAQADDSDISDDDDEVIFISSQVSRTTYDAEYYDTNANMIINQDHVNVVNQSYDDDQDVAIFQLEQTPLEQRRRQDQQILFDHQLVDHIDALEPLGNDDLVEIEPNKFSMVRDPDPANGGHQVPRSKIEFMEMRDNSVDYGDMDKSASLDTNVKVCTDILKTINFDDISLSSLRKLRSSNKKLQRMSRIQHQDPTSIDSDTKVFNEIWNAVKMDKYDSIGSSSQPGSFDSDVKVFNTINKSLSQAPAENSVFNNIMLLGRGQASISGQHRQNNDDILEETSCSSSVGSLSIPDNPGPSPVYYPASQPTLGQIDPEIDDHNSLRSERISRIGTAKTTLGAPSPKSEKSITVLREHCSSRIDRCSCDVNISAYCFHTKNKCFLRTTTWVCR
jgi:hypothetical protein